VIITGKDDLTCFAEYLGVGVLVCVYACVGVSGWPSFLYHIAKSSYLGPV
jgi:hypothetical protein